MRHIGKFGLFLRIKVPEDGSVAGLKEEFTRWHEPSEGEEVDGDGIVEEIHVDFFTLFGVEFVGGVVLDLGRNVSSVLVSSDDDYGSISKTLDGGVPSFALHVSFLHKG